MDLELDNCKKIYILGISGLYHDSAAALICDGSIIAAAQEERFSRIKHDSRIPKRAIEYCLKEAAIKPSEIYAVVYYDQPFITFERFYQNLNAVSTKEAKRLLSGSFSNLYRKKLWVHELIRDTLDGLGIYGKLLTTKHHISHAASAFYPSPYNKAIIMTVDGVGEWTTTAIGVGNGTDIEIKEEIRYPHSLGLLYSAFTYYCGFKVNSGDYKFMGLAPYGHPRFVDRIKEKIIDIKEDGSFRLNLDYFDYHKGGTMVNEERFNSLFGGERRKPESMITQREMDIASSVQLITEEIIIKIAKYAKDKYGDGIDSLVMAGGVALNCVANGKLQKEKIFKNIWIQPAAGDAGGALGAALYTYYKYLGNERHPYENDSQNGSFLGPSYSNDMVKRFLESKQYPFHFYSKEETLIDAITRELCNKKIIGMFRGRMEYGPRALGNRSIIADCRSEDMQSRINLKIKYRESFRPFAPIVLKDRQQEYFDLDCESPYMLKVGNVKQDHRKNFDLDKLLKTNNGDMLRVVSKARSDIPAVTHVDFSARIQSIDKRRNPFMHRLLSAYDKLTGCPVLVNTSFNVRGEPIVCSVEDAYACFMRTDMDVLVIENYILIKDEQPEYIEKDDWRLKYELD